MFKFNMNSDDQVKYLIL